MLTRSVGMGLFNTMLTVSRPSTMSVNIEHTYSTLGNLMVAGRVDKEQAEEDKEQGEEGKEQAEEKVVKF